jgi:hypothetical protein
VSSTGRAIPLGGQIQLVLGRRSGERTTRLVSAARRVSMARMTAAVRTSPSASAREVAHVVAAVGKCRQQRRLNLGRQ